MDLLRRSFLSLGLLAVVGSSGLTTALARAEPAETITVASTTSTEQSGLFKDLLPKFTQSSGIGVKVVALGTGQALDAARRGDADVALVHDTAAEETFVAEGWSTKRYPVMYNDFVIVGPKDDPAGAAGASVVEALRRISAAKAPFVSRGDRSGTHSAELRYWKEAGLDLGAIRGDWYKEVGQGMGPALTTASATNAYVLSDRGTWLSFKNRGDLKILVEGDKRLFNQYGAMLVNPEKHPHVKAKAGQAFIDWLVSAPGQAAIAAYRIGGEQLFFPNAGTK
ncbi:substrate-binding domain-containing protein [Methylobacterium marchantiae]|uniref:Substrate-binding domain-containing protein n=1 Tax=Methylobacterium marchantiae TaxID=600331 RepID=A0ABW3X182_9HYPH|nr:Tungstate-binding protein TupA [Methylobacterium marchantiae]